MTSSEPSGPTEQQEVHIPPSTHRTGSIVRCTAYCTEPSSKISHGERRHGKQCCCYYPLYRIVCSAGAHQKRALRTLVPFRGLSSVFPRRPAGIVDTGDRLPYHTHTKWPPRSRPTNHGPSAPVAWGLVGLTRQSRREPLANRPSRILPWGRLPGTALQFSLAIPRCSQQASRTFPIQDGGQTPRWPTSDVPHP